MPMPLCRLTLLLLLWGGHFSAFALPSGVRLRLPPQATKPFVDARRSLGVAATVGSLPPMEAMEGNDFLDPIRRALPFLEDPSVIAPGIVYAGPIHSFTGKGPYMDAMRRWRVEMPQRLDRFEISDVQVFQLEPNKVQAKWSCSFIAPLPPPARARGLPPDLAVLPGERVVVKVDIRSDLSLDADGRIVQHTDTILNGYDIPSTIARYEFLTAQRLDDLPPVWYYKVLEATTTEEAGYLAEGEADPQTLRWDFYKMLLRSLLRGMLLGCVLFYATKVVLAFLASAPAIPNGPS